MRAECHLLLYSCSIKPSKPHNEINESAMPPLVAPTPPPSPPTAIIKGNPSIDDFDVGVTLGTGSFGRVRFRHSQGNVEALCHQNASKKSEIIRHDQVAHMLNEKEILWTLSKDPHPFIVNVATTFQDATHLYMVLQYIIGGEFFTHLRNAVQIRYFNVPVLRSPRCSDIRISPQQIHHIPRSQAGKFAVGRRRISQTDGLWLCQKD